MISMEGGKDSLLVTLTVISKPQIHLLNPSHVEEEDEFVEGNSSVDWDSPLIYDIYNDEEDLLEEVSF
jgi:hypothetical protein